jgi:hypothetical protein
MTTESIIETTAPAVNRVIVVGRLGTVLGRNQKGRREAVTVAASRTRLGGALSRFSILLTTPFGEPYALPIEVAPTTEGAGLLEALEEGAAVAVEGEARLVASYDGRYAAGETDKGRQVRDLQITVTRVRVPAAEEPEGTTAVWLTGTVVEPPRFFRHPEQPSMLLAQSLLEVYIERATSRPGYPGLRRLSRERVEVPVVVSAADAFAGLLYRPGNQVRVEGELARMIETQYGKAVTDAVAGRQAEWEAARAEAKSEEQARFELRRFQRQVRQLTEQARTRVVAGYVEAAGEGAEPIGEDEARALHREFQRRRRERRSTAVARAQIEAAATKIGQGEEEGVEDVEAPIPRPRPRRRGEPEAVIAVAPEHEAAELTVVDGEAY